MINLNRFDLVSLRLFVAVVDAGSLTAGADRFGISLAAASKRVAELEQHCGMPLLQRSQRGVTATPYGQALHRHAIDVVARLEQLALAVDDLRTGASGHLRLCANPSAFGGFLPLLLARYAAAHPDVRIDLADLLSEDGVRAVISGAAEVAIVGEDTPCDGLQTLACDVDTLVLLVPEGHALDRAAVPFDEALRYDLVTLPRTASLTRVIGAAAESRGQALRIRIQVRSFDVMCRMVAAGMGVAILPSAGAALYRDALRLRVVPFEALDVQRRLVVAMRDRAALSLPARWFVDQVEAERHLP